VVSMGHRGVAGVEEGILKHALRLPVVLATEPDDVSAHEGMQIGAMFPALAGTWM
jgi:hypothetical protein